MHEVRQINEVNCIKILLSPYTDPLSAADTHTLS